MKKIIATLVLLALLSAAVFAQDDGSGWKIGFKAQLVRDFFYTTKQTGEGEVTVSNTPSNVLTDGTTKVTLGDYIKGSSNMYTVTSREGFDQRIAVSLSNNGDHHSVYIDLAYDDAWVGGNLSFMNILTAGSADWWFAGDTGGLEGQKVVLDAKVGSGRYGGFVPVYEIWDDYIGEAGENFFGVHKYTGFLASNNISTTNFSHPWCKVYAIGATFADNFRFALGSTLDSFADGYSSPTASASNVEAGFIFSGKGIADLLSFDLFYAVKGGDTNTVARGTGEWANLIGVYAGLDLDKTVKGLGVSVGYTANFTQNETAQVNTGTPVSPVWKTYETVNPTWSGIDINVKFDGIEKVGINFNNNISFAGTKVENPSKLDDDYIVGLGGVNPALFTGDKWHYNENWFAYRVRLSFRYALTGRLGVTFALNNLLTVYDYETEESSTFLTTTTTQTGTNKETKDNLITSLHADYNAGNVTFGIGLTLGIEGVSFEKESKSSSSTGTISTSSTRTEKGKLDTVRFGIPLFFRVAF